MNLRHALALLAMINFWGCTSAVAPTTEGSTVAGGTDSGGGTTTVTTTTTSTSTSTSTSTTTTTSTSTGTNTGSTTDTGTDTDGGGGDGVGEITGEETDAPGFAMKSVYGTWASTTYTEFSFTSKGGSITLITSEIPADSDSFKKVASVSCEDCDGADDPACADADPSVEAPKMISFSFAADAGGTLSATDENGFPEVDAIDSFDAMASGVTLFATDNATGNTGTLTFASGKRPTAAGEDFEAEVDITLGDGKKYKSTITGTLFDRGTYDVPACDVQNGNKKLVYTYE